MWLSCGFGFYLVLELGPFFLVGHALRKPFGELVGPYLAFAAPGAILLSLVWLLKKWEKQGVSSKLLARGWSLMMALFGIALTVAVSYSGFELRLIGPKDAVVGFIPSGLLAVFVFYFGMYHMALKHFSARAVEKPMAKSDEASFPT